MEMALEQEACGTRMRMELCCGRMVMGCGRQFGKESSAQVDWWVVGEFNAVVLVMGWDAGDEGDDMAGIDGSGIID